MDFINFKDQYMYEGSSPFIHWFPGPMSTKLYHYMPLAWTVDLDTDLYDTDENLPSSYIEVLDVKEENVNDIVTLALYKPAESYTNTKADRVEVINDEEYFNLEKNLTNKLIVQGQYLKTFTNHLGIEKHKYVFVAYLITRSYLEYEFVWDLRIGVPGFGVDDDGNIIKKVNYELIRVGTEFYGENENLKINLMNMGVEIPEFVTKALYEGDMFERETDRILLNRKWRELLINFMDIIGTKGSYNSLINSLKWFEYGDLVEMREIWRAETPDGTKFFDKELTTNLTNDYYTMLTNSVKTTSFYLRNLINDTAYNEEIDGKINCKWVLSEMRLKMILLGNFFEEYFMPVHTELIRSVCEEIDRCFDINMRFGYTETESCEDNRTTKYNLIVDVPKTESISNVRCYCLSEAPGEPPVINNPYHRLFEQCVDEPNGYDYSKPFEHFYLAMHEYKPDKKLTGFQYTRWGEVRMYGGPGVLVPFKVKLPEDDIKISRISMTTNLFQDTTGCWYTKVHDCYSDNMVNEISFNILFTKPGIFSFNFDVTGSDGNTYMKGISIEIKDDLVIDFDYKKLCWKGPDVNPFKIQNENNWEHYMFSRNNVYNESNKTYNAYIPIKYTENPQGDKPRTYPVHTYAMTVKESRKEDLFRFLNELNDYLDPIYKTGYIAGIFDFERPNNDIDNDCYFVTQKLAGTYDLTKDREIVKEDWPWDYEDIEHPHRKFYWRIGTSTVKMTNFEGNLEDVYTKEEKNGEEWIWIQIIDVKGRDENVPIISEDLMTRYNVNHYTQDVFIPEFHELKELIEGKISRDYPILISPVFRTNKGVKNLEYSYGVDGNAWEFFSWTNLANINLGHDEYNIKQPFIASKFYKKINKGMYDVTFKYNLSGWDLDGKPLTKSITKTIPFVITD